MWRYNASCLQRVRRYLGLYSLFPVSVVNVAGGRLVLFILNLSEITNFSYVNEKLLKLTK